jgi:cobaltochelatase CobT
MPPSSKKSDAPITQRIVAATKAISGRKKLRIQFGGNNAPEGLVTDELIQLPKLSEATTKSALRLLRGQADLAALSLRHHKPLVHSQKRPKNQKAGAVFDALELMRIQLLGSETMKGVAHNLDTRLTDYCENQGYKGLSERADPPVADILALLLREKFTGQKPPAFMQNLIQLWRGWAESQGALQLEQLARSIHDQSLFAKLAHDLVKDLGMIPEQTGDFTEPKKENEPVPESEDESRGEQPQESLQMQTMPSFAPSEGSEEQQGSSMIPMETGAVEEMEDSQNPKDSPVFLPNYPDFDALKDSPNYHAYTRSYDEVVMAEALATPDELSRLRMQLDQKLENLRSLTSRFTARLQRLLLAKQARQWVYEQEEGLLNSARLTRAVITSNYPYLYKYETDIPFRDTVVTLLLDNSGSMRGRPISVAAVSADILGKTLERCGVKVEVLGFTTRDWKGGQSRKAWQEAGRPVSAGRLNDLRHIIYKAADARWSKARKNLGLMLKDGILKENIDGEAILWACERLLKRTEQRKILMVISDGAPVDDSTLSVNTGNYLDQHLREVIHYIEDFTDIELLAIGIGHDVTRYYKRAVTLSDVEQLGTIMVSELTKLFAK